MYKNYDFPTGEMLLERFAYMFNKPSIGFSFYRGWMPILAGACIEIDHLLGEHREAFHWVQIKEKFGTARLYYSFDAATEMRGDLHLPDGLRSFSILKSPDGKSIDLKKEVSALVDAAERETCRCCIVCGQPAKPQEYSGYLLNLCATHHPEKARRPGDVRWEAIWELATPVAPEGRDS